MMGHCVAQLADDPTAAVTSPTGPYPDSGLVTVAPGKIARRRLALSRRRDAGPDGGDEDRCSHLLALCALRGARTVAAYLALPGEPDPAGAVARWVAGGLTVLLPVLLGDGDLAFADARGSLRDGLRGTTEPAGPATREWIAEADLVIAPALGVDLSGARLGRGGGSYDRAMRRARPDAVRVALVRDGEVGPALPVEPHDVRVHAAVSPAGVWWLSDPPASAPL